MERIFWTTELLSWGWDIQDTHDPGHKENQSMRRVYNRLCNAHPREAALVLAIEEDNLESINRNLSF
jgi:hypothetical protein